MPDNKENKENNQIDENEKKAKKAGDEIIEILDNYRREHDNPPMSAQKSQEAENKKSESDSDDRRNKQNIIPEALLTHLSTQEQGGKPDTPLSADINPHLSVSADKKELHKAQKQNKGQRFKKQKKSSNKLAFALGGGSLLFKAVFYIAFVLIISAYLSYYIIAVGNDVFALVKESLPVTITIEEDATEDEVAEILVEKGLIEYGWVFKLYLKYRSDEEFSFVPGEHELSADMNYSNLIQRLTVKYTERIQVRVVIPEGFTTDQIIDLFLANGIGTREGYVEAINNYPYKHEFVRELEELGYPEERIYRLEGYLFPDTYDFYIDTAEYLVINRLLNNFNTKFWRDYKTEYEEICEGFGMTFDDIITLAAMIQAEGNNALDFEYMSYVFHNRMENSDRYPEFKLLQSDATIQYVLDARREDLTVDDLALDNPYNTYIYEGLPPGAICNPGYDAISAALYPSRPEQDGKTINAFYFVSNKIGKTYYSSTLSGHNKNKEQVKKDNASIEAGTYHN